MVLLRNERGLYRSVDSADTGRWRFWYTSLVTPEDALEELRGRALVPVARASVDAMKALHADCLRHDVPAALRRPPEPGG
ncbi:MAG: hypothetical protein AAFU79_02395 [Myxococcota bacterium]